MDPPVSLPAGFGNGVMSDGVYEQGNQIIGDPPANALIGSQVNGLDYPIPATSGSTSPRTPLNVSVTLSPSSGSEFDLSWNMLPASLTPSSFAVSVGLGSPVTRWLDGFLVKQVLTSSPSEWLASSMRVVVPDANVYSFRLHSRNAAGFSQPSLTVAAESRGNLPSNPSAPTASSVTATSVQLTWAAPTYLGGSGAISRYEVYVLREGFSQAEATNLANWDRASTV